MNNTAFKFISMLISIRIFILITNTGYIKIRHSRVGYTVLRYHATYMRGTPLT